MTLIGLLIAVLVTAILVWLVSQGHIPAPFTWIVYAVLVVVWLIVLLQVTGVAGRFDLGRISQVAPVHSTFG